MPTYTPGPSALRQPFPVLARIVNGTPFSDAGVPLITALQAGHGVFEDRLRTMGTLDPNDLTGDYRADVAPALDAIGALVSPSADPELVSSVGVFEETIDNLADLSTTLPSPFDDEGPPGIPELPPPPDAGRD
jgi:hypothetical protein